jgi:hypothetical protein
MGRANIPPTRRSPTVSWTPNDYLRETRRRVGLDNPEASAEEREEIVQRVLEHGRRPTTAQPMPPGQIPAEVHAARKAARMAVKKGMKRYRKE